MATRSAGSLEKLLNTSFSRRLAARSMAFALGRSRVTSRIGPSVRVLMPADITVLLVRVRGSGQTDQRVDRHRAAPARAHDDGIQVELDEALEVSQRIARAG